MKGQWTVTDTRLSQSCVFVGHTSDIGYTRVQDMRRFMRFMLYVHASLSKTDNIYMHEDAYILLEIS